jgi:hypothetical protein
MNAPSAATWAVDGVALSKVAAAAAVLFQR